MEFTLRREKERKPYQAKGDARQTKTPLRNGKPGKNPSIESGEGKPNKKEGNLFLGAISRKKRPAPQQGEVR